jgi:hypothetical protein
LACGQSAQPAIARLVSRRRHGASGIEQVAQRLETLCGGAYLIQRKLLADAAVKIISGW